jgi:hypothetical protein
MDFPIGMAIDNGWLLTSPFRFGTLQTLITERGKGKEPFSYQFKCPVCNAILRESRLKYDYLSQRHKVTKRLIDSGKCPVCGTVGLRKEKVRTPASRRERIYRDWDRIQMRRIKDGKDIPLSPKQVKELFSVWNFWDEEIAPEWEKLTTNNFLTGSTLDEQTALNTLAKKAKKKLEIAGKALGIRYCARPDCFEPLLCNSRGSRKYCSDQCKAIEKTRRARSKG